MTDKTAAPLPLDDVIMDERECARMLHVSPETLNGWRRRGQAPPYFKLTGHVILYSKRAVLEWLQSRTVESGARIRKIDEPEPETRQ